MNRIGIEKNEKLNKDTMAESLLLMMKKNGIAPLQAIRGMLHWSV
jgi:hypothetical protein